MNTTINNKLTFTLRARWFDVPPIAGDMMAAPKGSGVFRIVHVTSVRTAGDPKSHRFRLTCERLTQAEVPEGAPVLPWCVDPNATRQRRPGAPPDDHRSVCNSGETPAALIARIRKARAADELARVARAARVGRDDGVRHGRNYGPGLRLRPARGPRGGERLREADVEIEDGPDPERPNNTVRRARRSDPLIALLRARTISGREFDAAERLRNDLQAAETSIPCSGQSSIHVSPFQRIGINDRQINAASASRCALAAVGVLDRAVVLWIVLGGTIRGYAEFGHVRHTTVAERLRSGLVALADHYGLAIPA